ncbi:MAG TPA: hypothetical protein VNZ45_17730 [Bacteroidia bacterium]|jgi:hypothetical protein|nr:hypothetical protein [Bacteroidia bacterium]
MKKGSSIFLSLIFMLYLGGMQVMYWVKIESAKKEASVFLTGNKFQQNTCTKFMFSKAEFNKLDWSDNNKEFKYKGQLYDISQIKYLANGVELTCYSDNTETEVVNAFHSFIEHIYTSHSQSGSNDNDMISKIIKEYVSVKTAPLPDSVFTNPSPGAAQANNYTFSLPASIWHPPASC